MSETLMIHISLGELSRSTSLPEELLLDMVEHGIAVPVAGAGRDDWQFAAEGISLLQKAARLQRDLDINWPGIALVLELLEERDRLLRENARLRQRLARFVDE